jgi:predicted alpha-1,2-mannosidase
MKKLLCLVPILLIFSACTQKFDKGPAVMVDPFIGTDGHGHTFPGATLPFGMVQLSPDTRKDSWDGCSGYHYTDRTIMGFSHTHLSGTGVGDYGDIRFMPLNGDLKIFPGDENQASTGYRSSFNHNSEIASPGYYQVHLNDYNIDVKLTATKRCGFHSYTFPASDESYILIGLSESVTSDRILDSYIKEYSDHEIGGYRRTSGWANNQVIYFYAVFNKPFNDFGIYSDSVAQVDADESKGTDIQAFVKYQTKAGETILVKVGISATGIEGAKKNLETEIKGWNFNAVKKSAVRTWNKELSKIEIEGGTPDERRTLYTALYHSFIAPNIFDDVDGKYLGHDFKIHEAKNFDMYTVFSLWDTYRALHPLFTILQPKLTNDIINSFLDMDEKGGLLPVWELAGNETNCMIGYHSVSVIEDAYKKGYRGFNAP